MGGFWFWVLIVTLLALGAWLFRRLVWRPVKAAMGTLDGAVHFRTYAMHVDQPSMGRRFGDLLAALGTGLDRYMDGRPGGRDAALPGWTISALDRSVVLTMMAVTLGPLITWAVLGHGGTGGTMLGLAAEARDGARLGLIIGILLLITVMVPLIGMMQPGRSTTARVFGFILLVLVMTISIIFFVLVSRRADAGDAVGMFGMVPALMVAAAAGFFLLRPVDGQSGITSFGLPLFSMLLIVSAALGRGEFWAILGGIFAASPLMYRQHRALLAVVWAALALWMIWQSIDVMVPLRVAVFFVAGLALGLVVALMQRRTVSTGGRLGGWWTPIVLVVLILTEVVAIYALALLPPGLLGVLHRPFLLIFTLLPIPGGVVLFLSQGLARRAWRQGGWRLGLWPLLTLGLVALHGLALLLVLDGVNRLDPAAGQAGAILPLATLLSDLSQGGGVHIWLYVLLALPAWPLFLFLWAGAYAVLSTGIRFWDGWILAALDRARAGEDAAGRVTLLILTQAGLALITVTGMVAGALYLLFDQVGLGAILIRGAGWLIG